jgi:tRNA A-37 threonylcarbamoyl transferase component Bud32
MNMRKARTPKAAERQFNPYVTPFIVPNAIQKELEIRKQIETTMKLVREGSSPNTIISGGGAFLHLLAENNTFGSYDHYIEEIVNQYGADINMQDDVGRPPLLYSIDAKTAIKLIQLGARDRLGYLMGPLLKHPFLSKEKIFTAYQISFYSLINSSDIQKGKELGQGTTGKVFLGQWNGVDVAIKEIDRDEVDQEDFALEARMMFDLTGSHAANVVQFVGFGLTAKMYRIVMEYVCNGTLFDLINQSELDYAKRFQLAQGMISGLKAIHDCNIIHCDLKTDNILLGQNLQVKITDFGNSAYFNEEITEEITDVRTSPSYCPPEIDDKHVLYSPKADIFSLAIMFWEVAEWCAIEDAVFSKMKAPEIRQYYQSGKRPTFSEQTPYKLSSLIKRCWEADPNNRPTSKELHEEVSEENYFQLKNSI